MRKVVGLCVLAALALLAAPALFSQQAATTRYVNKTDSTCQGHSPCYPTIQAAVDAAQRGDTVRIQAGTYIGPWIRRANRQVPSSRIRKDGSSSQESSTVWLWKLSFGLCAEGASNSRRREKARI